MNTIDMIKLSDIIRNTDTNVSDKLKACELLLKAHEENELKKIEKRKNGNN
jgi:hypothetical protein